MMKTAAKLLWLDLWTQVRQAYHRRCWGSAQPGRVQAYQKRIGKRAVRIRVDRQAAMCSDNGQFLLTIEQCRALVEVGTKIEKILRPGQDIE